MYRPVLVTPPAILPVTLAAAKAQLDVDYDDKDDLIAGLIAAATAHLDGWTGVLGRCLVEQVWRQDFDGFCRRLYLPLAPVISISSIKYDDENGDEQTIDTANYRMVETASGSVVVLDDDYSFPALSDKLPPVRITYSAGYANDGEAPNLTSTVPAAIQQAILLLVRHWFDNPGAVVVGVQAQALPLSVDALLAPYRRVKF